ncbi:NADH-quinone oxidoreductase subunit L [Marinobacter mobilis]|uniref:NADH-quinone oxidoreductase subunit L n=1 Tax=Marinobacter mobilis TaxID=488533 RepID=UPI0035C69F80
MQELVTVLSFPALLIWLLLPVALLVLAAFSGWTRNPQKLEHCWVLASRLFEGSMGATLLLAALLMAGTGVPELGRQFGLYPDGLAIWMALLVAFIGWVILRYARNYLRGDPARDRFLPWFLTTLASVLLLLFTDNLLVLAGAWVGISLALHHLLTLYSNRTEARLAALQKFLISRVGDLCVIGAVLLLYAHYGTFHLPEMLTAAGNQSETTALTAASVLFAIAAVLKCAQIPFHGWLLRVMEAPTPVSALLHAGVINLGGYLWLRLFPVFDGFTAGHLILLVVGGLTAVVAVLTMMSQASVKHALAWSTSAQMGFMLFEIGMGAYTLAFLHLVAHSLYKAHSFLASGRTVAVSSAIPLREEMSRARFAWAAAAGGLATLVLWSVPSLVNGNAVLGGVLVLAVFGAVAGIAAGTRPVVRIGLCALALAILPLYGALHWLVDPIVATPVGFVLPVSAQVTGIAMLLALALLSTLISFSACSGFSQVLRIHVSHGFYLMLPFDRLTVRLSHRIDGLKTTAHPSNRGAAVLGDKS